MMYYDSSRVQYGTKRAQPSSRYMLIYVYIQDCTVLQGKSAYGWGGGCILWKSGGAGHCCRVLDFIPRDSNSLGRRGASSLIIGKRPVCQQGTRLFIESTDAPVVGARTRTQFTDRPPSQDVKIRHCMYIAKRSFRCDKHAQLQFLRSRLSIPPIGTAYKLPYSFTLASCVSFCGVYKAITGQPFP
jgi:hypothetical protein